MAGGVLIGLSNLVVAPLLTDTKGTPSTYEDAKLIAGAIAARINPNASNSTLFADDGPFDVGSTVGEIALELNVADLSLEDQALLLGHTIDANGIMRRKSTDVAPWVAVGFKSLKSNGKYRYTWLTKGKFAQPEQNNQTKGDSIEFNTPTITGAFVRRESDNEWQLQADEDSATFTPALATAWFESPNPTIV